MQVKKMPTQANDPHIIHLTGRVDRLETDVMDIKTGVQKLLDRPQNPGLQQVLGTLVSTLMACALIFGFAEWRLHQAVDPVAASVAQNLERTHTNDIRLAVQEERDRWLTGTVHAVTTWQKEKSQ